MSAGEEHDVRFAPGREPLASYDRNGRWVVEPGSFRVLVGASSKDIRLRSDLEVQ